MAKRKKRTCDYCGVDITHRRGNAKFCKDSHKVLHHQYGPKPKNRKQQLTVDEPKPPKPRPAHGRGNEYQIASPASLIKQLEQRIKSIEEDNRTLNGQLQELDKTFEIEVIMEQLDEIQARRRPPGPIGQYVLDVVDDVGTYQASRLLDMPGGTLHGYQTGQRPLPRWFEEEYWLEGWICEGYGPCPMDHPDDDCVLHLECNRERR